MIQIESVILLRTGRKKGVRLRAHRGRKGFGGPNEPKKTVQIP